MQPMKTQDLQYLLSYLMTAWKAVPVEARPNVLWIGHHQDVPADNLDLPTPVLDAWVLSEVGLARRKADDLARLLHMWRSPPWFCGTIPPSRTIGEIGLSGFASIAGTDRFFVYFVFSGLNGKGTIHGPGAGGSLELLDVAWVS